MMPCSSLGMSTGLRGVLQLCSSVKDVDNHRSPSWLATHSRNVAICCKLAWDYYDMQQLKSYVVAHRDVASPLFRGEEIVADYRRTCLECCHRQSLPQAEVGQARLHVCSLCAAEYPEVACSTQTFVYCTSA